MSDPTGYDALAFWLAYVHPAWMVIALALAALALRLGLNLRRARLRGLRREAASRRRHLRLAKTALVMLLLGFAAGPASAVWLRGWEAFATAHSAVAGTALALFGATGWLGWRLERGRSRARDAHALLGVLSTLVAAAAVGTGFVLLP